MIVSLFSLVASPGPQSSRGLDDEARDASRVLGMLETGYLVVRADGVIDPAEYENLLVNWREWVQAEVSGSEFGDILADLEEYAQEDGLFGRLVVLREVLDFPARRTAFRFAAALAVCDGNLDERESEVLVQVAAAFELSDEEVEATLSAVEDALSAGAEDAALATTTSRDSGEPHEALRSSPQHLHPQSPRRPRRERRVRRSPGRRLRQGRAQAAGAPRVPAVRSAAGDRRRGLRALRVARHHALPRRKARGCLAHAQGHQAARAHGAVDQRRDVELHADGDEDRLPARVPPDVRQAG